MDWIDKQGIETLQKQALSEQTISEYGSNGAQFSGKHRKGRQRRLRHRCHSKYGILTAKFHLLGVPPLIPLPPGNLLRFEANSILGSKRGWPQSGTFPLPTKGNPPFVPRQGRAAACAAAREPASPQTGRALTGAVRRIYRWARGNIASVPPKGGLCQREFCRNLPQIEVS